MKLPYAIAIGLMILLPTPELPKANTGPDNSLCRTEAHGGIMRDDVRNKPSAVPHMHQYLCGRFS